MRVAIVDDEENIRLLLQRVISRLGHEVVVFSNAVEAWEHLKETSAIFDKVVSDYKMPGMTGGALLVRLRSIGYRGGFYLISGDLTRESQDFLFLKEFKVELLTKPLNVSEVPRAIGLLRP